jgi:hypothetical protein
MDGIDSVGLSPVLPLLALQKEVTTGQVLPRGSQVSETPPADRQEEKKKQIARDFESVLLTKVFDQVSDSIGQGSFDEDEGDGASQQVQGLFWLYLAQDVADKGGVGMWREIYQHFGDIDGAPAAGELIDREL